MIATLGWMWAAAWAQDPEPATGQRTPPTITFAESQGLNALRREFQRYETGALPDELAQLYADACRRGWQPGCRHEEWHRPEPSLQAMAEVLGPFCAESGDRTSCLAAGWRQPPSEPELRTACVYGFAPACTELGSLVVGKEPARARSLWKAACGQDVRACTELGLLDEDVSKLQEGCDGGDGSACQALAKLTEGEAAHGLHLKACELGHPRGCLDTARILGNEAALAADAYSRGGVPDPAGAFNRSIRHEAHARACALGSGPGCYAHADDMLQGRGIPVDATAGQEMLLTSCNMEHGPACARLARRILDREALGYALQPRALYEQGCSYGHKASCNRFASFDKEQRRKPSQLVASGFLRLLPAITVRPYLGGSFALVGVVELPKVDAYLARRRVRFMIDSGAADYTFGLYNTQPTAENLTTLAVDWTQDPRPWGLRVALGGELWEGAPFYGDDVGEQAWPVSPDGTYALSLVTTRVDVEQGELFGPRAGLRFSVGAVGASSTVQGGEANPVGLARGAVSVFQRGRIKLPVPMRGGWSELSLYGGFATGQQEQLHAGVLFTDRRSLPLLHGSTGRVALSLVTDALAGIRFGEVPGWLAHHHTARLAPNIGSWQLLRGHPAALMAGNLPVRGRAGLRWWVGEYHGFPQHLAFYVEPWIEAGAAVAQPASLPEAVWRADGGIAAIIAWRRRTSFRVEALWVLRARVKAADGYDARNAGAECAGNQGLQCVDNLCADHDRVFTHMG